jgi:hypothetical protein
MNITLAQHAQRDLGLSAPQAAAAALHSSPPFPRIDWTTSSTRRSAARLSPASALSSTAQNK